MFVCVVAGVVVSVILLPLPFVFRTASSLAAAAAVSFSSSSFSSLFVYIKRYGIVYLRIKPCREASERVGKDDDLGNFQCAFCNEDNECETLNGEHLP